MTPPAPPSAPPEPPATPSTVGTLTPPPAPEGSKRKILVAVGALAIVAIIAVVAIVLAGGDDSKESASTTTPSATVSDSTEASVDSQAVTTEPVETQTGDTQTGGTEDGGSAAESEPFAGLLPRATRYGILMFTIDRLVVRAQDPASFQSGAAAAPDGPRWAYIEGTVNNPLVRIAVSIESTEFTLVLGDGTELRGGQFGNDPVITMGSTAALNVAFELGDVTDLANSVVKISDPGREPSMIALDGDPLEPYEDREVAFDPTAAGAADANGNTVEWGFGETSTGLDSYYDGADKPDGQSTADRRAGVGNRWINMSVTLTAGACTCDGITADTSMVRMVVDGTTIEPANTFSETLAPGTSLEVGLIFEYPAAATTATLQVGPAGSPEQQTIQVTLG